MKGICFKEHLFKMVVDGSKTQTRRIINPQPMFPRYNGPSLDGTFEFCSNSGHQYEYYRPRYNIGEKVYLKEPYSSMLFENEEGKTVSGSIYRYGVPDSKFSQCINETHKWGNKLFMPESKARYFIEITNVKVERLQDISERDCIKEGIKDHRDGCSYKRFFDNGLKRGWYADAKESYKHLINAIDGKDTWDNNPFVFVYDFKLTTR